MNKKAEILLDEQKFPCFDMTKEERNQYLNIIHHCKDVCDTENKVGNYSECKIHEMVLRRDGNAIIFNGILSIGEDKDETFEGRCIRGELYVDKDMILVYMNVERFKNIDQREYSVVDEFKLKNNVLIRKTRYNYLAEEKIEEINNEKMKGLIK